MSATVDVRCPQCGYVHAYRHDALACNAIHGRASWLAVRDPEMRCALCGLVARTSVLVGPGGHFETDHGHSRVTSGMLVLEVDPPRPLTCQARAFVREASGDAAEHVCSLVSAHGGPHYCQCGTTWEAE